MGTLGRVCAGHDAVSLSMFMFILHAASLVHDISFPGVHTLSCLIFRLLICLDLYLFVATLILWFCEVL